MTIIDHYCYLYKHRTYSISPDTCHISIPSPLLSLKL